MDKKLIVLTTKNLEIPEKLKRIATTSGTFIPEKLIKELFNQSIDLMYKSMDA